jgi:hypothetical protein
MSTSNELGLNLNLVFIQLGSTPEEYVWRNILRCKSIAKNMKIYMVSDSQQTLNKAEAIGISAWRYSSSTEVSNLLDGMTVDLEFRGGFWRYSLERLFALNAFQESHHEAPLLHIENDIFLFENFPWEKIIECDKLMWLPFNMDRDVASIIYSPSKSTGRWLHTQMIRNLMNNQDLSDMSLLRKISSEFEEFVNYFPIANDSESKLLDSGLPEVYRIRISLLSDFFNGIFDGASLGMWLTGQDPRNHFGRLVRYRDITESALRTAELHRTLTFDNSILQVNGFQLYNLHVHSKNLKLFGKGYERYLSKYIKESTYNAEVSQFSFWGFWSLLKGYLKRRLFRLLRNFGAN